MKKTMLFFVCVLILSVTISCNSNKDEKEDLVKSGEAIKTTFTGVFTGTTPCADCPGIYLVTSFSSDGSYYEHMKYLERDTEGSDSGTWTRDDSLLIVKYNDSSNSLRDFYLEILNDSTIRMLDQNKNPITGSLADYFILHKKDTVI